MFHTPNVRVNPDRPEAQAICDRCGRAFNHVDLVWQYDWRGDSLTNLRILVCQDGCEDEPQEQFRPRILPPDPEPVENARPPAWAAQEGPPPPLSC